MHGDDVVQAADGFITMGCGDACAIHPGKRYLDSNLTDPAGFPVEHVRTIRDQIRHHMSTVLAELDQQA